MKKHDILSLLFLTLAGTGAALVYLDIPLPGQILYVVSTMASIFMTKSKGAPLQAWIAMIITAGFGYVTGDWLHSGAATCAMLAINLRGFIWQENVYGKNIWAEPLLAITGVVLYVVSNLIHENGWQGWTFPAPVVILGVLVCTAMTKDRVTVQKLISNGLIETGSEAPDFSLTNYDGKQISLSDYKGVRDMLLIFVRGDWCPGCHIMLRLYERERKKFQDKNVMLFAIGPDPVGVNRAMVEKLGLEFAVLADEKMEVSRKYCLEVQEGLGEFEHGVPLPASFLVDKQGVVRYTSRANNAGEFLAPDIIFDVLAKI